MTVDPRLLATQRLLEQEQRWRAQAEALAFDPPNPEIGRRRLLEFVRWSHLNYLAGWFHRELCLELERFSRDVAAGRSPRLIVAAPPRHGKSKVVSVAFPVWHLGRNPTHEIVVASYGQDLANEMSQDARALRDQVLEESAFGWPHLAPGTRDGTEHWRIKGGGSYKPVGAGGPLTGRGCHILVIDDIVKNAEEADSETTRESRWKWYTRTAYTRLAPGGGVLLMATRWHFDDPSGRALEQLRLGEEPWRVVSYPAVAEDDEEHRKVGEALHPERWPLPQLAQIRKVIGPRGWAALYQQRPTPETGGVFQRPWLAHRFHPDPKRVYTEIVISVDATFTRSKSSDYVSAHVWGRIGWSEYHVLDELHDRMSFVECLTRLRLLRYKWPTAAAMLIELAGNGYALVEVLAEEIPGVIGIKVDPKLSKVARALHATPLWEAGQCKLPVDAVWVPDFVEEHAVFPAGAHDDRVDDGSQVHLWWRERRGHSTVEAKNANLAGLLRRAAR